MWQEIVFGPVFKIIDKLIPDKIEAERLKLETIRLNQEGEFRELEKRYDAITAEANSSDKWTSRARPAFMYVFHSILLSLTIIAPAIGVINPDAMAAFFANVAMGFKAVPEELWWTFTAGYLGYTGFRSLEKKNGISR
jgi:hypothetical protein